MVHPENAHAEVFRGWECGCHVFTPLCRSLYIHSMVEVPENRPDIIRTKEGIQKNNTSLYDGQRLDDTRNCDLTT